MRQDTKLPIVASKETGVHETVLSVQRWPTSSQFACQLDNRHRISWRKQLNYALVLILPSLYVNGTGTLFKYPWYDIWYSKEIILYCSFTSGVFTSIVSFFSFCIHKQNERFVRPYSFSVFFFLCTIYLTEVRWNVTSFFNNLLFQYKRFKL